MEISDKRKVTNYVRECIKNGHQIKTRSGKYGFIPHKGEDKLFEQCYKEEDPIRKHFKEDLYLSEKYCHLVRVCKNGNVEFIKPREYEEDISKPNWEKRWRYFKDLRENGENICPNGIPVYAVYALVFKTEYTILSDYEEQMLENNIYTAFGTSKGKLQAHHIGKYKEPELDEQGIPIFNENINDILILRREIHDLIYWIPSMDEAIEEAKKYDEALESYIPEQDKDKTIISVRRTTKGRNKDKTGKIFITGKGIKDIKDFMKDASPEYPRCIITFKGSEEKYDLYKQTVYQCMTGIADTLKNLEAGQYEIELYNGIVITAYKHIDEAITSKDIRVTQPVKL